MYVKEISIGIVVILLLIAVFIIWRKKKNASANTSTITVPNYNSPSCIACGKPGDYLYVTSFGDQKWATGQPNLKCPGSINGYPCVYTNFKTAYNDCVADTRCKGMWNRDGSSIGLYNQQIYQLADNTNSIDDGGPTSIFYKLAKLIDPS